MKVNGGIRKVHHRPTCCKAGLSRSIFVGAAWRLKGDLELDSSPENARLSYAALLRSQPVLLDDLIRLAVAHLQTGRRVEARALFQAILAISPDHAVALKGLERAQAA